MEINTLILMFFGLFVGIGFFMTGLGMGLRAAKPAKTTGFFLLFGSVFGGAPLLMSFLFLRFNHSPSYGYFFLPAQALLAVVLGVAWSRSNGFRRWLEGSSDRMDHSFDPSSTSSDDTKDSSDDTSGFGGGSSGGGGASGSW